MGSCQRMEGRGQWRGRLMWLWEGGSMGSHVHGIPVLYMHVCQCVYVCMYIYIHTCVYIQCVCVYICVCVYTCVHTHTQIYIALTEGDCAILHVWQRQRSSYTDTYGGQANWGEWNQVLACVCPCHSTVYIRQQLGPPGRVCLDLSYHFCNFKWS